jgi:hypothetical protein
MPVPPLTKVAGRLVGRKHGFAVDQFRLMPIRSRVVARQAGNANG